MNNPSPGTYIVKPKDNHSGIRDIPEDGIVVIEEGKEMRVKTLYNPGTVINYGYLVID